MGRVAETLWGLLLDRALSNLPARLAGEIVERHAVRLAGTDQRIGRYALESNNPQAIQFLIDVYPELSRLLNHYSRNDVVRFLDIGPAFGGSAGLISELHRSNFLGPQVKVEVLDITDERRAFIEFRHPHVDFLHSAVENIGDRDWDIVYCSNAIEHIQEPQAFIKKVLKHTLGHAMFLAPYREEEPRSLDHKCQIDESSFEPFEVEAFRIFETAAWPTTADGTSRFQILAIIKGEARA